jgi:hypothetical protein
VITGSWYASLFAGLIFAFTPRVWEMAITTEVYNVNIGILAVAFFLILVWHRHSSTLLLYLAAFVFGVSLGSYLANILLLPAFIFWVWQQKRTKLTQVALFVLVAVISGSFILSWSYFRSGEVIPIGTEFIPDSLKSFTMYLTGAQYEALSLHSSRFYFNQFLEHAQIFSNGFTWLGVSLGLLGLICLWKKHRSVCPGLLLIFIANMGYFTGYHMWDYYTMVTPSYFVFSLWIACGIYFLARQLQPAKLEFVAAVLPVVVLIGLLIPQMGSRLDRSRNTPVTDFVLSSFERLPTNAIVVANWNQFTPLLYFQRVHGLRQDLTIIELGKGIRYYSFGAIGGWPSQLRYAASAVKPLYVFGVHDSVDTSYLFRPIGNGWYQAVWHPQTYVADQNVDTPVNTAIGPAIGSGW